MTTHFFGLARLALAFSTFAFLDGNCLGSMANSPRTASVNDNGIRTPFCRGLSVIGRSRAAVAKLEDAPALDAGGMDSVWSLVGATPAGRTYYSRFSCNATSSDQRPMTLSPQARENFDRLRNFQSAMASGTGLSRSPDERGQRFDKILKEGGFKQSGLDSVASTLMENIRRVLGQAELPMMIFNYGREYQAVVWESCAKHGFAAEPLQMFPAGTSDELIREECRKGSLVSDDVRDWLYGIQQRVPSHCGGHFFDVAGIACHTHELLTHYENRKQAALNDFCAALVIQSWTMFEAVSEDLWVAALNSHPATLAKLKCRKWRSKFSKPSKSDESEASQGEPDQDQQQGRSVLISLDNLQKDGFDLSKRMGAILKRRFSFQAIDGIRSAYFQAFSKDASDIDAVLNDDGLQLAAAVRHVLIHKRGIVDKEFQKQTAAISGDFLKVKEDDPYPLTGAICAELSDACRCCSTALVVAVHDWIVAHPASSSGGSDE